MIRCLLPSVRFLALCALGLLFSISMATIQTPAAETSDATPLDAETLAFVQGKVIPLLKTRCDECHGAEVDEPGGGLWLSTKLAMLDGGDSGSAIVPGSPDESLLISAIRYEDFEMPPKTRLPEGEITILTKWIEMGAPFPDTPDGAAAPTKINFPLQERIANHWSWRKVTDPALPEVSDAAWPSDDLDHFILAKLEAKDFSPAPDADRATLIRRAYFDLVGLPPSPAQVAAFVDDPDSDRKAFAKVVDELLASPHFGERWARHWLDLARFAETRGHEYDHTAANAYHYRDYVIRALNDDLPYDQFTIEHFAGDLLDPPRLNPEGGNESILATGFWYLGDWIHSPVEIRRDETDRVDHQIDVMGRTFLGLTIACARCHDHKFDAITADDYYAMAGFLQSSQYRQARFDTMEHNAEIAKQLAEIRTRKDQMVRTIVATALRPTIERLPDYLAAALIALRSKENAKTRITEQSTHRALDPNILGKLVAHLQSAEESEDDPLHAMTWYSGLADSADTSHLEALLQLAIPQVEAVVVANKEAWADTTILVDFGKLPKNQYVQEGFAFGERPTRSGDLRIQQGDTFTLDGIHVQGGAHYDRTWDGLKMAPGVEVEGGATGERHVRAGRTLRTPTFTVGTGELHYLVRGKGEINAVVDAHRLIAGPLHGGTLVEIDRQNELHWVTHKLHRYKGHRVHVEFTALPGHDLEVYLVTEGKRPPLPTAKGEAWKAGTYLTASSGNAKKLAEHYQQTFQAALATLAAKPNTDNSPEAKNLWLVDWLIRNRNLFLPMDDSHEKNLQNVFAASKRLEDELAKRIMPTSRTAIAILDGTAEDERYLVRGSSENPKDLVPRRFLEALGGKDDVEYGAGSGRLRLAQQIIDTKTNPYFSRVIVNRLWHHLFGRGIVPTVDNFGVLGQAPSHPELLDHLATRIEQNEWSLKQTIRQIVLSRTYRMSSKPHDERIETEDPDNILLHRMRVRRLEGEIIRDAMLTVSGRLDRTVGGPSIPVHVTAFMTGRGRPSSGPLDGHGRRSIYTKIRRNFLPAMMLAFDMPIPFNPVGRRNVSNVPAQPLILMNHPLVTQQADLWAKRILAEPTLSPEERIEQMYLEAYSRRPNATETAAAIEFLKQQATTLELSGDAWQSDRRVWRDLGHVLWNVKEFIFIG